MSAPRLWLVAVALWVTVTTISAIALWHLRNNALDGQWRETSLLALALTDELDRGLHGVEQGLSAMRAELHEGRLSAGDAETVRRLGLRARFMPLVRTLWVVDRDGRLLLASDTTPPPNLNSFSPSLDQLPDRTAAVSRPFTDAITRQSLVAVAVRAGDENASGGWVIAGLPANALFGAFSVATPGSDAHMAVLRNDGVRLVGTIVEPAILDEASLAQLLARQPSMTRRRFRDGSERLVSLNDLPRYGLKMILTRDTSVVLRPWREIAQGAAAGIALLLLILIVSVRQITRSDRRYVAAQNALQAQLSRAGKLEALGSLAGGVAHDFNNVLAAILGFGEMAQDLALPNSKQSRYLDKLLQATLRGKALIERILTFSRGGAHRVTVFELEPIIEEVLTLLDASPRHGVALERVLQASSSRLRGDPTRAFEAIMNLCTNALQAMPDGGVLNISLKRVHVGAPRVLSHSRLAAGDYVCLSVTDQGTGISPEVMDRLFEPFFSARGERSGTGLGLAVVHGVVAEFGGAIDVQSAPGHGSRFALYFPECTDAVDTKERLAERVHAGGGQRLLVVEDDPSLLALAEEMLKGMGYEPVAYADSGAALAVLRENSDRFAAVITDEVMPGLCGTQLTRALREFAPDLPVLLISGYGGTSLVERALAAGVTRVLVKPLQRQALAETVSELLSKRSPA